ncbi:hypothetical protein BCR34DRAFT_594505 [Clohesyomyces aquaticus]|uniref:Uncharacterized protein n=1 Tax=Clohesyomyces aquaticus TaxID=1231657 RepID=A0A1Y1Y7Z7_9PLEO|nr:hypothetical protein BCR34DRAFT_594505 [Clohesyomyces aquaticus]
MPLPLLPLMHADSNRDAHVKWGFYTFSVDVGRGNIFYFHHCMPFTAPCARLRHIAPNFQLRKCGWEMSRAASKIFRDQGRLESPHTLCACPNGLGSAAYIPPTDPWLFSIPPSLSPTSSEPLLRNTSKPQHPATMVSLFTLISLLTTVPATQFSTLTPSRPSLRMQTVTGSTPLADQMSRLPGQSTLQTTTSTSSATATKSPTSEETLEYDVKQAIKLWTDALGEAGEKVGQSLKIERFDPGKDARNYCFMDEDGQEWNDKWRAEDNRLFVDSEDIGFGPRANSLIPHEFETQAMSWVCDISTNETMLLGKIKFRCQNCVGYEQALKNAKGKCGDEKLACASLECAGKIKFGAVHLKPGAGVYRN